MYIYICIYIYIYMYVVALSRRSATPEVSARRDRRALCSVIGGPETGKRTRVTRKDVRSLKLKNIRNRHTISKHVYPLLLTHFRATDFMQSV